MRDSVHKTRRIVVVAAAVILAAAAALTFYYMNFMDSGFEWADITVFIENILNGRVNKETGVSTVSFDPRSNPVFESCEGRLLMVNSSGIRAYNTAGMEEWEIKMNFVGP